MAHTTHKSILDGLHSNEEKAWRKFQEFYAPLITICGQDYDLTQEEIEDLRQDVMAEIYKSDIASKYDPMRGRFRSLLRTIIHRKAYAIRKQRIPRTFVSVNALDGLSSCEPSLESRWEDEWREFVKNTALKILRDETNERQYMAFDLYALQNMDVESVALIMKMNVNQIYIAKSRLESRLQEIVESLKKIDGE
ncbi:MAG: sigma-70 family RNA polymerase sigma factor [Lentisphaeria bacterium]|nr:sigma-70 family RNA polymerase sigma factor [Lentisphaeria bacterium]